MTLTFAASANTGLSGVTDGVTNPNNNNMIIVGGAGSPFFRSYNLNTMVLTVSATPLNNPGGVSLINSSSAIVTSTSTANLDLIQLSSGFRQNYGSFTSSVVIASKLGGQVVAGDPSTSIAFAVPANTNGLGQIVRVDGNTFTVSQPQLLNSGSNSSELMFTIILKSPGRWLIGTTQGRIIEINSNAEIIDEFTLCPQPFPIGRTYGGGGSYTRTVTSMSLDNNLLTVVTFNAIYVIDWSTKTIIKNRAVVQGASAPFVLCAPSSGVVLGGQTPQQTTTNSILELDTTIQPLTIRDQLFHDIINIQIAATGINDSTGKGWFVENSTGKIRVVNINSRPTTLHTITVQSASSGGLHLPARLLILDDTNGVGTSKVILDTYMQSPAIYRVPTNSTLIECVKVGSGSTASWDVTRFTT